MEEVLCMKREGNRLYQHKTQATPPLTLRTGPDEMYYYVNRFTNETVWDMPTLEEGDSGVAPPPPPSQFMHQNDSTPNNTPVKVASRVG